MPSTTLLAPLPYAEWEATKTTLHLWTQVIGKLRLAYTPHRNHWWNVTLLPTVRGLSTQRMREGDTIFEFEFDFIDHALVLRSNRSHAAAHVALRDGLSVARFYAATLELLADIGVRPTLLARPYGVPMTTPFAEDEEHHSYDAAMVRRWFDALVWSAEVFDAYASAFVGKQSPAHLFWHSFDLAMARFSGRPAPGPPRPDVVQQEAYSHEVIAVGFWPGDPLTPQPTYYTYTAPEPSDLTGRTLRPAAAGWQASGNGHMGTLPYDAVRTASDPRAVLLDFIGSGYEAGTASAGWNAAELASAFSHPASARGQR